MSQNPDDPRENPGQDKDEDLALDYAAFASDEPDFPEDRLNAEPEPEEPPQPAAESAPSPEGTTSAAAVADEPAVPPADSSTAPPEDAEDSDSEPTTVLPTPGPAPETPSESEENAGEQSTAVISPTPTFGGAARADSPQDTAATDQSTEVLASSPREPEAPVGPAFHDVATGRHDESITDADIDEEVTKSKRGVSRFFTILIAIFTPLLLGIAAVRMVGTPAFLWLTYNRPGAPSAENFDTQELLLFGSYGTDYLFNGADSRYLSQLAPGGEPLFTTAEVAHMTDVKLIIWSAMLLGLTLLVLTVLFALLLRAWRPGGFVRGLFAGSWATIGLIAAVVAVPFVIGWNRFFVEFHEVAFFWTDNPWCFNADGSGSCGAGENLTAIYPDQFWVDAGIAVAGLMVLVALIIVLITWPTKARRARRKERLDVVHDKRREKLREELQSSSQSYSP